MAKHTPGPWQIGTVCKDMVFAGERKQLICETASNIDKVPTLEDLANARLIAAAPEMLLALKSMRNAALTEGELTLLDKIDAVIAKAEGRT